MEILIISIIRKITFLIPFLFRAISYIVMQSNSLSSIPSTVSLWYGGGKGVQESDKYIAVHPSTSQNWERVVGPLLEHADYL